MCELGFGAFGGGRVFKLKKKVRLVITGALLDSEIPDEKKKKPNNDKISGKGQFERASQRQ